MEKQYLFLACLVLCLGCQRVMSVCPDIEETKESIQHCRNDNWATVLNTDAITTNDDACGKLQSTVSCIVTIADDCGELESNYLAPAMYSWAMTSDALRCDTTFKGQHLVEFEDGNCTFYEVYECYKEVFDLMYIQPESDGDEVDMSNLKTWLTAKTQLVEDREGFCDKYFNGRSDSSYKKMSKCAKNLKKRCLKLLPMHEYIPEKPQNVEDDPYTLMDDVKTLVDKLCLEECADMEKKEAAARACGGEELSTVTYDISNDNNKTENCELLKTARDCMMTELNSCTYIVEKVENTLTKDLKDALTLCKLEVHLGSTRTLGAAGVVVSLTLMVVALLSAIV